MTFFEIWYGATHSLVCICYPPSHELENCIQQCMKDKRIVIPLKNGYAEFEFMAEHPLRYFEKERKEAERIAKLLGARVECRRL